MDRLAGISAKLERGDHHFERVELEVAAFLYSNPWKVAFQRDPQRGLNWWLATFAIERYPPAEWSIRVGEAVHQYRSALDHLMTELSRLRHKGYILRPDRSKNFPIYPTPGEFWAETEPGHSPAKTVGKEVRAEHFAELERLQPKQPKDMEGSGELPAPLALALLRWVDDLDKHAAVRPSFIAPKSVKYHALWSVGNYGNIDIGAEDTDWVELWKAFAPLHHGTQLYSARFRFGPQMSVPMTIEPDVNFGMAPHEWITLETLRGCFEWVRRIIDRFREITPEFRPDHDAAPASKPNA
jgi:hypothetical protein